MHFFHSINNKVTQLLTYVRLNFLTEFLCFVSCLLLNYSPNNFKIAFVLTILLFGYILFELRSFFLSLYLLFFVTSLFLTPGKFYSFIIIPPGVVSIEPFLSLGVSEGYGVISSDFVAIALILYFIWQLFRYKKDHPGNVLQLIKDAPLLKTILLSLLCFFIAGLYSAFFMSLFPTFSIVNLIQYLKIALFIIATISLLSFHKKGQNFLEKILVGGLLFNYVVAIPQFFGQLSGLLHETLNTNNSVQLDDQSFIPRVWGSFLHANEFGLFIVMWFLLLVYINPKKYLQPIWILPTVLFIAISQSRSVWLGIITCIVLFQIKNIFNLLQYLWKNKFLLLKKYWVILSICTLAFVGVIAPRILALRYTLDGGSGAIRVEMIEESWQILQDSPEFGYGANTNVMELYEKFPHGAVKQFPFAVHMGYLQLALEVGLLGTLFFFFPFFFLLYHSIKARNNPANWLLSAILTFIMIYYMFQPHGGRLEFPLLGLPLGYICYILTKENFKKTH